MKPDFTVINPKKTAILVIDIQKDFVSPEGYATKTWGHDNSHLDKIVEKIKKFLEQAQRHEVEILYTQTIYDPEKVSKAMSKKLGSALGEYVAPNSEGIQFYKLNPPEDKIFIKYAISAFTNPNLCRYLKQKQIENLIILGFNSNICVEGTARAAVDHGFHTTLVEDLIGTTGFWKNHETELLATFGLILGYVTNSEEILRFWEFLKSWGPKEDITKEPLE